MIYNGGVFPTPPDGGGWKNTPVIYHPEQECEKFSFEVPYHEPKSQHVSHRSAAKFEKVPSTSKYGLMFFQPPRRGGVGKTPPFYITLNKRRLSMSRETVSMQHFLKDKLVLCTLNTCICQSLCEYLLQIDYCICILLFNKDQEKVMNGG